MVGHRVVPALDPAGWSGAEGVVGERGTLYFAFQAACPGSARAAERVGEIVVRLRTSGHSIDIVMVHARYESPQLHSAEAAARLFAEHGLSGLPVCVDPQWLRNLAAPGTPWVVLANANGQVLIEDHLPSCEDVMEAVERCNVAALTR